MTATAPSATTDVYQRLRRLILTLQLPPGTALSEPMLMNMLDAGRTPVREALRRLADDRLIVIFPRRGLVVAQMGFAEVQQLFEARLAIERQTAYLAGERADQRDINRLLQLNEDVHTAEQRNTFAEFLEADQVLHREIAVIARNSFLLETAEKLLSLNLWLWYSHLERYGVERDDFAPHHAVITAIAGHDSEAAAMAMEAHIIRSRTILRVAL